MRIKHRLARALLLAALPLQHAIAAEEPVLEVEGLSEEAFVEFDERTGVAYDPAGIRVTYEDVELTARRVRIDRLNTEVLAEGDVNLRRGVELWKGERLRYNFVTRRMDAATFRTRVGPILAGGHGLTSSLTNQTHSATNAMVTTDDVSEPLYMIRAKHLKFVAGEYVEARNATIYLGKVPIMYYPKYRRYLDRRANRFDVVPGIRSAYGPYLLGTYNWYIRTNLDAGIHLDYRIKRGVGGGPDLDWDFGRVGEGGIKTYFTYDQDPGSVNNEPIDNFRERIAFSHSAFVRTNLSVKAVLRHQSDPFVVRDFFVSEYRENAQPLSFLEVDQLWPNFSLNLLTAPQVNRFYELTERLPDVKLSATRQRIGISPFYYEGENSVGYFRRRSGDFVAITNQTALRADTFHQLLLPQTLFGWLNVAPRTGARFTHYGRIEGLDQVPENQDRFVFNTGVEFSAKASRLWRGTRNDAFEISGLRHIVEPLVNYVYIPTPNRVPQELPQFDYEWYSFGMLPIDFPEYNSIDSIDSQNVIRLGLRNKLQTQRELGLDNLVNWSLMMDWRLKPQREQQTFSDIFSSLDFRPKSWLSFSSQLRYDLNTTTWRVADHMATIQPNNVWQWQIGHRYLLGKGSGISDFGNNTILSSLFLRMNENWAFRFSHHFEARDGTLEEQYYTVYRDMRSWTAGFTFRVFDNRSQGYDYTFGFTFSFKAFPRYRLGEDRDQPGRLLDG